LLAQSSFVAWFGVDVYSSFSLLISSLIYFFVSIGLVAHVRLGFRVSFVGVSLEGAAREGWEEVPVVLDMDGVHWSFFGGMLRLSGFWKDRPLGVPVAES
jgi:hypothetical protein